MNHKKWTIHIKHPASLSALVTVNQMTVFQVCGLTSSYMNCKVRADFPTPPLPTIITLCSARELWFLLLLVAISGFFFVSLPHSHAHKHTQTHIRPSAPKDSLGQPANEKNGNIITYITLLTASVTIVNNYQTVQEKCGGKCRDRWQLLLNRFHYDSKLLCQDTRLCSNKS